MSIKYLKIFLLLHLCHSISFGQISLDHALEADMDVVKKEGNPQKVDSLISIMIDTYNPDCVQKGRFYQKIGHAYYMDESDDEKAISFLRDSSFNIWKDCPSLEPQLIWNPAFELLDMFFYYDRSEDAAEIIDYLESKPLVRQQLSSFQQCNYYRILGSFLGRSGDRIKSKLYLQKSIELALELDTFDYTYRSYNQLGIALQSFGEIEESITAYDNALKYSDDEYPLDAFILNTNKAESFLKLGKYSEALDALNAAKVTPFLVENARENVIYFYRIFIEFYIKTQDIVNAELQYDHYKKLQLENKVNFAEQAFNHSLLGRIAELKGLNKEAETQMNNAVASLVDQPDFEHILSPGFDLENALLIDQKAMRKVLLNYLDMFISRAMKQPSNSHLEKVWLVQEEFNGLDRSLRKEFQSEFSKLQQLQHNYNILENILNLTYLHNDLPQSQQWRQKACELSVGNKNSILQDLQSSKDIYKKMLNILELVQIEKLDKTKRSIESNLIRTKVDQRDSLNQLYLDHLSQADAFKQELNKKYPILLNQIERASQQSSFNQLTSLLSQNLALIDIFYGKDHIYVFVLYGEEVVMNRISRTQLLELEINQLSQNLNEYGGIPNFQKLSKRIYEIIFKPSFDWLNEKNVVNVCYLSDGPLHNIPLESYWTGNDFLLNQFDISYLYTTDQLFQQSEKRTQNYLGFGTQYSQLLNENIDEKIGIRNTQLSRLPGSVKEVLNGKEIVNGSVFLNEKASKHTFLEMVPNQDGIIHTALHGLVLDENSSGIIFDDRTDDILLTSNEVYGLDLKNDLTILSACYSAQGKVFSGEGVRNLARSFLYAGSKNLMSSQWAASDASNEKIISSFFKEVKKGIPYGRALTFAKRKYLESASPAYQHPSYWANMVYAGSNESHRSNSLRFNYIYPILGLLVLSILALFIFRKK